MKFKLIITLTLLLFSQIIHAEVSVSVDRNPAVVDESFKLIFETDHKIDAEPDFSSLDKSFTISNTGRRSNTQIINGDVQRSQQWILTAIAKQSGAIAIPSIRFGKKVSKPRSIKVVGNASTTKDKTTDDIFIEVDVDTRSPYVQGQIIYTVKFYRAVATNNVGLSEPRITGGQVVINKLGADKSYNAQRNNKRYVVIERNYVIFPQSSGPLTIEPLIFRGMVGHTVGLFSFDPFGPQPDSIVKRSAEIKLDVKPIPDSFAGDTWLPARQLNIHEQWSIDPSKLKRGEATTCTLTLQVDGLTASQLPNTNIVLPDSLKSYPDQPEFENTNNKTGLTDMRRDKMAIIPTEPGDVTLAAFKIPWWNTKTDS